MLTGLKLITVIMTDQRFGKKVSNNINKLKNKRLGKKVNRQKTYYFQNCTVGNSLKTNPSVVQILAISICFLKIFCLYFPSN